MKVTEIKRGVPNIKCYVISLQDGFLHVKVAQNA